MDDTPIRHLSDLPPFVPSAEPISIIDDHGFEMVHVLVRLRDPDVHKGEALWATPVSVDDDGCGTYVVRNNALLAALRFGDVVVAERGSDGHLDVTGIAHLSKGPLTEVLFPEDEPTDVVEPALEAWSEHGALYTEQGPGVLLTAWPDSMSRVEVIEILERTSPPGWSLWDIPTATERAVQLINDVDFTIGPGMPATAL